MNILTNFRGFKRKHLNYNVKKMSNCVTNVYITNLFKLNFLKAMP